ncbi:MAG: hypothetical protein F9K35_06980 [Burkholderiaceae bacterium]|nr:MAG: hypothetical protein F9K35_06980 [Burkholderiaceae bacterium]
MPTITIHIIDEPGGAVTVLTSASAPIPGARLTPAQALGLELLTAAGRKTPEVHYWQGRDKALNLVERLLQPEGFGFAVTGEVRNAARQVLGIPRVPAEEGL